MRELKCVAPTPLYFFTRGRIPHGVRELKCDKHKVRWFVACRIPHGVRELKLYFQKVQQSGVVPPPTGCGSWNSPPMRGPDQVSCRTPHGVREFKFVKISRRFPIFASRTLHGVRELKCRRFSTALHLADSRTPHGVRELKSQAIYAD